MLDNTLVFARTNQLHPVVAASNRCTG